MNSVMRLLSKLQTSGNLLKPCAVTRVECGSDDPDNLGYFFGGLSGCHLQINYILSGCDLDITCSLENSIGIW